MAEENAPSPASATGKESAVDPSLLSDRTGTPGRRNPNRRRNIVILVVVAVLIVGGIFLWR